MGLRQRKWAARTRDFLRRHFDERCARCGAIEDLEFDVIVPTQGCLHAKTMEWSQRMSFYKKQLRVNNLQLLCSTCNSRKHNNEDQEYWDNNPF